MTKFGCVVKESKKGMGFLIDIVRNVPRFIFAVAMLIAPIIIGFYALVVNGFPEMASPIMYIAEILIIGVVYLVWAFIVAVPIITCYIYPKTVVHHEAGATK